MNLNDNHILLLFLVCIGVLFCYHKNQKIEQFNKTYVNNNYEHFQNNNNSNKNNSDKKFKSGELVNNKIIHGNSLLLNSHIKIKNNKPSFDNNNNIESESNDHKLMIDSIKNGTTLDSNGYIIINMKNLNHITYLKIKGIEKFRVDYNNDLEEDLNNKNVAAKEFKPVLYGKVTNHINKYHGFNLVLNNNKPLICNSIKITNLNDKKSDPIKLELYGFLHNHNQNHNHNISSKSRKGNVELKLLQPNNLVENKVLNLTESEINSNTTLQDLKLDKKMNIIGVCLKTNIPKFKLTTSKCGVDKIVHFYPHEDKNYLNGGVNNITNVCLFLPKMDTSNYIKLIPFINNKTNNNTNNNKSNNRSNNKKNYVMKDIKVIVQNGKNNNNNNNLKEGFENPVAMTDELKQIVEISKACEALELQENINQKESNIEDNLQLQIQLDEQYNQIKKLEEDIEELNKKRNNRVEQIDQHNIAKYHNNKSHFVKLNEHINKIKEKQPNFKFNVNLLNNGEPLNNKTFVADFL